MSKVELNASFKGTLMIIDNENHLLNILKDRLIKKEIKLTFLKEFKIDIMQFKSDKDYTSKKDRPQIKINRESYYTYMLIVIVFPYEGNKVTSFFTPFQKCNYEIIDAIKSRNELIKFNYIKFKNILNLIYKDDTQFRLERVTFKAETEPNLSKVSITGKNPVQTQFYRSFIKKELFEPISSRIVINTIDGSRFGISISKRGKFSAYLRNENSIIDLLKYFIYFNDNNLLTKTDTDPRLYQEK